MFQQQHDPQRQHHMRRITLATTIVVTTLAIGTGAWPAAARQDAGPDAQRVAEAHECLLERVGTQYVRCDNNTGNGVPAPAWVPAR